uniref:Secreted protein n=1 Tax=Achlya hypogyna TaxID=1202772 RepID=A0A0A7CM96_ACHHY|nr:secreted protein [Achlya hypogyna]
MKLTASILLAAVAATAGQIHQRKSASALALQAASVETFNPIVIKGQRMFEYETGKPFQVKGVDYYPRPNTGTLDVNNLDLFSDDDEAIWSPHIAEFQALGINTIRLYAIDPSKSHDKFMCALSAAGIYVLVDLGASCEGCSITKDPYPACYPSALKTRGQQIITAFAKYNNVLGFSAGNEVNHVVSDPTVNGPCQKKFIKDMRAFINSCSANMRPIPVGVVLADTNRSPNALYYNCRTDASDKLENAEWYGINVYLQCDPKATTGTVGASYAQLHSDFQSYKLAGPTMLTEFGCLNKAFPTVDGYDAQRPWASWLLSKDFADVFTGGFAFEFSTENANSKADAPYPFTSYGAQNYGLGYFSPEKCDHASTPCKYNRMPNFESLATQYKAAKTALPSMDEYSALVTTPPSCPSGFSKLSDSKWASDSVTDMLCPDLTQTKMCPGHKIITGKATAKLDSDGNSSAANTTISPTTGSGSSKTDAPKLAASGAATAAVGMVGAVVFAAMQ